MVKCHACDCEIEEGKPSRTIEYGGEDYTFCERCDNEDNIITDCDDNEAPRGECRYIVAYDGEHSYREQGRRIFLYTNRTYDDISTCCHCDEKFYGDMCYVIDQDEHVCQCCAENNYYYWDDGWHSDEEPGEDDEDECSDYTKITGAATDRFLGDYYLGFEFEHAPVRRGSTACNNHADLYEVVNNHSGQARHSFFQHHDGSIATLAGYASREIVSAPISGSVIDDVIDAFYSPFASGEFTPGPEHPSCGFHMHVSSRIMSRLKRADGARGVNEVFNITMQHNMREALADLGKICAEYVSSSRRKKSYCRDNPSVRDKNTGLSGSSAMMQIYGSSCYPSIAIRTIGTVEYRLWPSSNSIRYTKARAELSQKLTAYYDRCFIAEDGTVRMDEAAIEALEKIADLCRPVKRRELTQKLSSLLGLSEKTMYTLAAMNEKFNPHTYKLAHFKCSDAQIACLSDEPSEASSRYSSPEEIAEAGDTTTQSMPDTDSDHESCDSLYISFNKGVKCYPATGAGEQLEAVTAFAKGDI